MTANTGKSGALLAEDLLDSYAPLGAHGQPVHLAYVQLRAAVRQRLGQKHANLFSRPIRDPKDNVIRWFAEIPGKPVPWYELSAEDQALRAMDLHAMRAEFQTFIGELRGGQSGQAGAAHAFATVLEQALLIPDDRHVFFIGDQPVVSFWGFRGMEAPGIDPLSLAPRKPEPPRTLPVAPVVAAPARPWWHWLLWLLALLLLLAVLLFGLRMCAPQILIDLPLVNQLVPPEQRDPANPGRVRLLPSGTLGGLGNVEPGGAGTGLVAPGAPDAAAIPQGQTPPGQDQRGANQPEAAPGSEPPATDDAQKPEPPPSSGEPPGNQQQPQQPPPQPLAIPPEAPRSGAATFMNGNWRSNGGLFDQATGTPLEQFYRLGQDGTGQTVIRRADGVECTAPAAARMEGGTLTVEEAADPRCPDGRTFGRSKTTCQREGSRTVCTGVNPDGTRFNVGIEKAQ